MANEKMDRHARLNGKMVANFLFTLLFFVFILKCSRDTRLSCSEIISRYDLNNRIKKIQLISTFFVGTCIKTNATARSIYFINQLLHFTLTIILT